MAKQKFPHLVGSKWTAQQKTMGWRHFQVANRKNQGKLVFAELVAACDPDVRFWLNAKVLKNRQLWAAGWQTLHQIKALATDYDPPSKPALGTAVGMSPASEADANSLPTLKSDPDIPIVGSLAPKNRISIEE